MFLRNLSLLFTYFFASIYYQISGFFKIFPTKEIKHLIWFFFMEANIQNKDNSYFYLKLKSKRWTAEVQAFFTVFNLESDAFLFICNGFVTNGSSFHLWMLPSLCLLVSLFLMVSSCKTSLVLNFLLQKLLFPYERETLCFKSILSEQSDMMSNHL